MRHLGLSSCKVKLQISRALHSEGTAPGSVDVRCAKGGNKSPMTVLGFCWVTEKHQGPGAGIPTRAPQAWTRTG